MNSKRMLAACLMGMIDGDNYGLMCSSYCKISSDSVADAKQPKNMQENLFGKFYDWGSE